MSALSSGAVVLPRSVGIAVLVLRIALCLFFIVMAARNLSGDEAMAADFARWGYPDWFRVTTALLQAAGAVGLLVPGLVMPAAGLLALVLAGAIATHLRHDPPAAAVSPAVFLALLAPVVLWARRAGGRG